MSLNRNATLNILRQLAHALIIEIKGTKKAKGHAWEQAVPGTDAGEYWFKVYCQTKRNLVAMRRELHNTNALIKHIKKNVK